MRNEGPPAKFEAHVNIDKVIDDFCIEHNLQCNEIYSDEPAERRFQLLLPLTGSPETQPSYYAPERKELETYVRDLNDQLGDSITASVISTDTDVHCIAVTSQT